MRTIMRLFAKSPFEPLSEHSAKVQGCVALVKPLFVALIEEDLDKVEEISKQISKLEHKADIIKDGIRNSLPKRLFMPVDRSDVLNLLHQQDEIADAVEDIAVLISFKDITVPEELKDDILAFADKVISVYELLVTATDELSTLREVSFSGPEAEKVLGIVDSVGQMEWEADNVQNDLVKKMLRVENDPISVLLWMKIFEAIGALADGAEGIADNLRLMIAKA